VLEHETADGLVAIMLSEVEAYAGSADPASHSFRGMTGRNAVMFGPPGHAYVYFTYGMHFCANVVCSPPGVATGILLRAGRVVVGEDLARRRRGFDSARSPRDLARGPARLCQALAINRSRTGRISSTRPANCGCARPLAMSGPPNRLTSRPVPGWASARRRIPRGASGSRGIPR
jgi:DNA-3-methyladenine glycosylase